METTEIVIGPYWSYSHRNEDCWAEVNSYARLAAKYLMAGDMTMARLFGEDYLKAMAALDRCTERYEATRDSEVRWVGWR